MCFLRWTFDALVAVQISSATFRSSTAVSCSALCNGTHSMRHDWSPRRCGTMLFVGLAKITHQDLAPERWTFTTANQSREQCISHPILTSKHPFHSQMIDITRVKSRGCHKGAVTARLSSRSRGQHMKPTRKRTCRRDVGGD